MKEIKRNSNSSNLYNKNLIITFEIAILLTLIIVTVVVLKSDFLPIKEETSMYVTTQRSTEESVEHKDDDLTFLLTDEESVDTPQNENMYNNGFNMPEINETTSSGDFFTDVSGWSTGQIISKANDAVNKTKAYTGNLTVNHSESFTANVTECSAGGIVRTVVDLMIGWVVKPMQETLFYQNGKAVNSEGETVPIILPQKNGFFLNENGVRSATIQQIGNEYVVKISLIEESVGMYDVPTHNASSIGYLDVSNFDISFMEVDSANIVYKGSSFELRINAEGYVTYANYKIPLRIQGSAHKGSISGSATFEGEQTEEWRLNY